MTSLFCDCPKCGEKCHQYILRVDKFGLTNPIEEIDYDFICARCNNQFVAGVKIEIKVKPKLEIITDGSFEVKID